MENQKNLSRSAKKHIRLQKALIRKGTFDGKKQEELISDLYKKYSGDIISEEAKKEESPKPLSHKPISEAKKEVKKNKSEKKSKKNEVQKN